MLDWVGPGASEETLSLITAGALPLYTVAPFVAMLLVIAVFPLWIPHWWESNRNKLAVSPVESVRSPPASSPVGPSLSSR